MNNLFKASVLADFDQEEADVTDLITNAETDKLINFIKFMHDQDFSDNIQLDLMRKFARYGLCVVLKNMLGDKQ